MAQQIYLKRSGVAGKVPTVSSLDLGELAINVKDGKLYFKRDDNTVQTIITTGATATGNISIVGTISGSYLVGDGAGITNLNVSSLTAPGNDTEILFNDNGAFAASSNLVFDGTVLGLTGSIETTGAIISDGINVIDNAIAMAIALG